MADPTRTRALREDFIRDLARRFRRFRGLVRRTVGYQHDAFGLVGNAADDGDPTEVYDFPTNDGKIAAFQRDLQEWLDDVILERVPGRQVEMLRTASGSALQTRLEDWTHWTAPYIRSAYRLAWKAATGRAQQLGASVSSHDLDEVFGLGVPRRQLRDLYIRAYENLQGITDEMAQPLRRELTLGLAAGENPRKIADRLTSEVRSIERTRARTLARTEIIHSYSEATLDRYEDIGIDTVSHGEWRTAGDTRVCPICKRLDGREFGIGEMRSGTFQVESADLDDNEPDSLAGTYPLRPPAHPNGRCVILPVI